MTKWSGVWWVSFFVAVLVIAPIEVYARWSGIANGIPDSDFAWMDQFESLDSHGIAIVGSSRGMYDLAPGALAEWSGRQVSQLSIGGNSGLAVMEALADREDFRGIVLFDAVPRFLFSQDQALLECDALTAARRRDSVLKHVVYSLSEIGNRVSLALGFRRGSLSLRNILLSAYKAEIPTTGHVMGTRDRSQLALSMEDTEWWQERGLRFLRVSSRDRVADPITVSQRVERLKRSADALRSNGAKLIVLRLPVSSTLRNTESSIFPDSLYWNPWVASVDALVVDFEHHPSLQTFALPDGSHIAASDVNRFTVELCRIIETKFKEVRIAGSNR